MSIADELDRLKTLRAEGALSEAEFEQAKAAALATKPSAGQRLDQAVTNLTTSENSWAMLIHLSQFCGYALPLLGWVVPLVLWLMKRDESEQIDAHGKIVMNWILSVLIYGIVCGLFSIILIGILIGIPLAIALGIVGVVFPIIGAVKASDGELWPYPMSIRFLK
ncbi:MAG: DUF4870 domain-containing protein [Planctomycetes bacterium]|nr:DUF4870 domain-containing protein [Planctomycetota bacterium]